MLLSDLSHKHILSGYYDNVFIAFNSLVSWFVYSTIKAVRGRSLATPRLTSRGYKWLFSDKIDLIEVINNRADLHNFFPVTDNIRLCSVFCTRGMAGKIFCFLKSI